MGPDLDRTINRRRPTWFLVATVLVLVVLPIACGSDPRETPDATAEFGRSSESAAEVSQESAPGEIVNAIASGLWTGLMLVACALAQWWSPLIASAAVFLLRFERYSRYQASRYALSTSLIYGAAAGAAALLIAFLCWIF